VFRGSWIKGEETEHQEVAIAMNTRLSTLTALLLAPLAALPAAEHKGASPNILLIITDQQHAGMLSCAGNRYLQTPNLDNLARTGTRFERAYCGNPVCVPSRFCMLSGTMPSRIGMESNGEIGNEVPQEIFDHAMGTVFRCAGYVRQQWAERDWRLHRWAYARLTERVDGEIGKVLAAMRESGLEDNTLVIFTSDHGDMDSAHRFEHKSLLYEEAVRVPLLVSWKGVTPASAVDRDHLVSTGLDLIPTMCDFAGVPVPAALKGRSVKPLMQGRPVESWRSHLVVENHQARLVLADR
jgi:arylsulfatase A-like enzyme